MGESNVLVFDFDSTLFESEVSFSRDSEGRTGEVHECGFSNYSEINIPDLQLLFKIL